MDRRGRRAEDRATAHAPGVTVPASGRRAAALLALAALLVLAGCGLGPSGGEPTDALNTSVDWTAGESSIGGNHHSAAVGRLPGTDGRDGAVVAVPLGGTGGGSGCRLLVLDGHGAERWTESIRPGACTIHAVADPVVADFLGGPAPEVIAASTEAETVAYDARNGERRFAVSLTDYGYTTPVVANLTGDARPELVTQDVQGELYVVRPRGLVWRASLDAYTFADPRVADFDADGDPELLVGTGDGEVIAFAGDGRRQWNVTVPDSVVWASAGDIDDDPAREFIVTTARGLTVALDGRTGAEEWRYGVEGDLAAVGPVLDGDGDDAPEVYVTGEDARVRALAGGSGTVEWTSDPLSDGPLRSVPPAVGADVNGDGTSEIVATTGDGVVAVIGGDGTVRASYQPEGDRVFYTPATTGDLDGDGRAEVLAVYGDGEVVALSFD